MHRGFFLSMLHRFASNPIFNGLHFDELGFSLTAAPLRVRNKRYLKPSGLTCKRRRIVTVVDVELIKWR